MFTSVVIVDATLTDLCTLEKSLKLRVTAFGRKLHSEFQDTVELLM